MTAYKDTKRGTWFASFRYTDWTGKQKQKLKRGFATKKKAQEFERSFLESVSGDMNMQLKDFVEVYFRDKSTELKGKSVRLKRNLIEKHILPYFGNKKMNEITPADILAWQKIIMEKGFQPTYERMIQNQLTALYSHAVRIYNLTNNPTKKVKKMGKSDADELEFWTRDEYDQFIGVMEQNSEDYVIFEILFWTGIREGELLALTKNDFDFVNCVLHISKTYNRIDKKDVITTPKTTNSVRTISIPIFLNDLVKDYVERKYEYPNDERLFPIVARTLQKRMKKYIAKAEVRDIRVHDLRHSHAAYLIKQGVQPLNIKNRLGHKDISITMNTYGHLYPSEQTELAKMLDRER